MSSLSNILLLKATEKMHLRKIISKMETSNKLNKHLFNIDELLTKETNMSFIFTYE